ncbi:MAG: GntR family transcriptional regulator, partial [Methylobacterium sp.]
MNQSRRLRQTIETEIVDGRVAIGARLDETELAERFGVSRTPIREA